MHACVNERSEFGDFVSLGVFAFRIKTKSRIEILIDSVLVHCGFQNRMNLPR